MGGNMGNTSMQRYKQKYSTLSVRKQCDEGSVF